jgi:AcrR family transcriptional regulator
MVRSVNLSSKPEAPVATTAEDNAVIAALGTMSRGSATMFARRRRVLDEVRAMLRDGDLDRLGMRELARRSDVSLRTIYNAFGSKEALVATAIRQYYDRFLAAISEGRDPLSLDWVLSATVITNLRNRQIAPYLTSLVNLYFSTSVGLEIRRELQRVAAGFMRPWLAALTARRQVRPGVDLDRAIGNIASLQYAINQEWLLGQLPDTAMAPAALEAVLSHLSGLLRGAAAADVDRALADLRAEGEASSIRFQSEQARLDRLFGRDDYFSAIGRSGDST